MHQCDPTYFRIRVVKQSAWYEQWGFGFRYGGGLPFSRLELVARAVGDRDW